MGRGTRGEYSLGPIRPIVVDPYLGNPQTVPIKIRLLYAWVMAWTAPTKHLRQNKELLNAKKFYRKLSAKCNYVDEDVMFVWYVGLVQLIAQELRKHKFVRLPHIGDLAIVTQKSRPALAGKMRVRLGPTEILKFYPKEQLRRYMRQHLNSPANK